MTGSRILAVTALAMVLLAPSSTMAQSFNGAITGVVRDSSGAVVPGATLTLRNVATDTIVGTAVSGADGEYAIRNLAPARYQLVITMDGFQTVVLSDEDREAMGL